MKKAIFIAACCVLPGGFVLLGAVALLKHLALRNSAAMLLLAGMAFSGCAWNQNGKYYGFGMAPDPVSQAVGERIGADAYAVRKCADYPDKHCRAMQLAVNPWGQWNGFTGPLDTSGGMMWGPQAAAVSPEQKPANASSNLEKRFSRLEHGQKEMRSIMGAINKKFQKGN